jgi:hypothetical protein
MAAAGYVQGRSLYDIEIEEFDGQCFPDELFLSTNEKEQEQTLQTLQKTHTYGNTYIGTSALFNLNAASVKPNITHIIIFDRSEIVRRFWINIKEIIIRNDDRRLAASKIIEMIEKRKRYYFGSSMTYETPDQATESHIRKLRFEIVENLSFLSDDIRYARIKDIFSGQRFRFFKMDLENPISFQNLAKEMKSQNLIPDIVYTSNTKDYCDPENYFSAVAPLVYKNTLLIDTYPRDLRKRLTQRVRQNTIELPIDQYLLYR